MAVEDADDRAVFFDTGDFAVAATYTPPAGGTPAAVQVVLDRPTARSALGITGVASTAWKAFLAADQATPAKDGTLAADGMTFKVRRADRDETGKIWELELEKQA